MLMLFILTLLHVPLNHLHVFALALLLISHVHRQLKLARRLVMNSIVVPRAVMAHVFVATRPF